MTAATVTFEAMFWRPFAALRVAHQLRLDRRLAATLLAAITAFSLILAAAPTMSSLNASGPEMRAAAQTDTSASLVGFEQPGSPVFVGGNGTWSYDGSLGCCVAPNGAGIVDDVGDVAFRSDTSHIFRDSAGHLLEDTATNRSLIQSAIEPGSLRSTITLPDGSSLAKYFRTLPDGTQVWAEVRNGVEITNGGLNAVPR